MEFFGAFLYSLTETAHLGKILTSDFFQTMIQVGPHLLVGCPGKKWFHCLRLQVFHSMWWEKATAELYILHSHFDNWLSKEVICFNFNKMLPFSPVYSHDPLLIFTNFWDPCLCRSQLSEVNVLQVTVLFFFFFFLPYVLALEKLRLFFSFLYSKDGSWKMPIILLQFTLRFFFSCMWLQIEHQLRRRSEFYRGE